MTIGTYLKILVHGIAIGYAYHDEINEAVEAGAKAAVKGYRLLRMKMAKVA